MPNVARKVSVATQRMTDNLFYVVADGKGGVLMVPKPAMQASLDRHFARLDFRDGAGPMNNLAPGGRPLSAFLPRGAAAPSRDQSATGSQGTQGSAAGGRPRRQERPPEPPSLKAGQYSVDRSRPRRAGDQSSAVEERRPSTMFAPSRTENDGRDPSDANGSGSRFDAWDQELPPTTPTTTAAPSPLLDEEPDDTGLGETVAHLPPPDDGCVYKLEPQRDGSVAIVHCLDNGDTMSTADRTYRHKISGTHDAILARMNRVNRGRTRDADMVRRTLFRHVPAANERLELVENPETGSWDLVVFSAATPNMNGPVPPGTSTQWRNRPPAAIKPAGTWNAQAPDNDHGDELSIHELVDPVKPARTGDHRSPQPGQLARMNVAAREFWRRPA